MSRSAHRERGVDGRDLSARPPALCGVPRKEILLLAEAAAHVRRDPVTERLPDRGALRAAGAVDEVGGPAALPVVPRELVRAVRVSLARSGIDLARDADARPEAAAEGGAVEERVGVERERAAHAEDATAPGQAGAVGCGLESGTREACGMQAPRGPGGPAAGMVVSLEQRSSRGTRMTGLADS